MNTMQVKPGFAARDPLALLRRAIPFGKGDNDGYPLFQRGSSALALGGIILLLVAIPASADTIAITGGTVYTLTKDEPLKNATVLIEDNEIAAVGTAVDIPDDARVFDAGGKIVTPGLIDANSHIGLVEVSAVDESVDYRLGWDREEPGEFSAAFFAPDGFNPRSTLIPVNRIEGITRAMVAPAATNTVIAGQGAIADLAGPGAYLMPDSRALYVVLGEYGARIAGGARAMTLLHLKRAFTDAQDFAEHADDFMEGARREYAIGRLDLEALQPYLNGERPVVIRAHRASDILNALELAKGFGLDLIILGGAEAWLVADELAAAQVPVILNPLLNLPAAFESLGATLENAARLQAAGVTVALSTGDSHNARKLKQAAGNAVSYGLPWIEGLKAITVNPARVFGILDRVGTLEQGKLADVVVWNGDPLEVTTTVAQVFIEGEAVPMVSRQTLLRDRYLEAGGPWPPAYVKPAQ